MSNGVFQIPYLGRVDMSRGRGRYARSHVRVGVPYHGTYPMIHVVQLLLQVVKMNLKLRPGTEWNVINREKTSLNDFLIFKYRKGCYTKIKLFCDAPNYITCLVIHGCSRNQEHKSLFFVHQKRL